MGECQAKFVQPCDIVHIADKIKNGFYEDELQSLLTLKFQSYMPERKVHFSRASTQYIGVPNLIHIIEIETKMQTIFSLIAQLVLI